FLGELETGREVVSLGRTRALPVLEEIAAALADRAAHAEVTLEVSGGAELELPLRPRMLRVVVENLIANSIRYAGPGSTSIASVSRVDGGVELGVAAGAAGGGRARRGGRRQGGGGGGSPATVRAVLPRRPGAHVARHRARPGDRQARG